MSNVKTENIKPEEMRYMKEEKNVWEKHPTPTMYNTKTEEEEEEKFLCAVCEHTSYSMEVGFIIIYSYQHPFFKHSTFAGRNFHSLTAKFLYFAGITFCG